MIGLLLHLPEIGEAQLSLTPFGDASHIFKVEKLSFGAKALEDGSGLTRQLSLDKSDAQTICNMGTHFAIA